MADLLKPSDAFSVEKRSTTSFDGASSQISEKTNASTSSINPLVGIPEDQILEDADKYAIEHGLEQYRALLKKGALVAQDPTGFEAIPSLSEEDRVALRREVSHPHRQPYMMYFLVVLCSLAAAVQGMDESVINGANLFFPKQFGIQPDPSKHGAGRNEWLLGLVNSAPYLCCAVLGCWLTSPLNYYLGRRGTIFVTAIISFATCIWQGVTNSWQHLFVARFVLGLGIGPKSATVPVFAAECAPSAIRGGLVMMWQIFTAFGIMLGYVMDLAFFHVPNKPHITGLNWRLMLGSAGVPAFFLFTQVFFCPESPRWLVSKGRHAEAFKSLLRLRNSEIEAARDLYYMRTLQQIENNNEVPNRNRFIELVTVPRNRRAAVGSLILMFMQQFCGINVIAYYSSSIFTQSGFTETQALIASWGFGMTNFIFAFPGLYTIDRFGRRRLLLTSMPFMSIFLLMTGLAFYIPDQRARVGVIASGIYLYTIAYSPGMGPVPFVYSAEAYPMAIRDFGMSLSTAFLWFFNFIVAMTFPALIGAFTPQGAFGWYAAWNVVGFVLAYFFVPETKGYSLEELDHVFSVSSRERSLANLKTVPRRLNRLFSRKKDPASVGVISALA